MYFKVPMNSLLAHQLDIYLIKNCDFGFIKLQVKSMLKCNLIKLSAIHALLHFINNHQHYSTNLMHPMTNHPALKEHSLTLTGFLFLNEHSLTLKTSWMCQWTQPHIDRISFSPCTIYWKRMTWNHLDWKLHLGLS